MPSRTKKEKIHTNPSELDQEKILKEEKMVEHFQIGEAGYLEGLKPLSYPDSWKEAHKLQ